MFEDLIDFPIETDRLRTEVRQVVRDLDERPHLLERLELTGTYFPQRAEEPFVTVGDRRSRFVEITDDGRTAYAYFDRPVPERGRIQFGYGEEPLLRLRSAVDPADIIRLDPDRLPENTRLLERFTDDNVIR